MHGGKPWKTELDNPYVAGGRHGRSRSASASGRSSRARAGSIPIVMTFQQELGAPTVLFGIGVPDENAHAPNEKLDLGNFFGGILSSAYLLQEIAQITGN